MLLLILIHMLLIEQSLVCPFSIPAYIYINMFVIILIVKPRFLVLSSNIITASWYLTFD